MKHVGKRVAGVLLALTLAVGVLPVYEVQAAALSAKTKEIYRKSLAYYICELGWTDHWSSIAIEHDGVSFVNDSTKFALVDLDGDKQKELCLKTMEGMDWQAGAAFKKNGSRLKVVRYIPDQRTDALKKEKKYLAGCEVTSVSDKAFLYEYMYSGGVEDKIYYKKTKGGVPIEYAWCCSRYDYDEDRTKVTYSVAGKEVTKEKYVKAVNSLGKFKDIQYYDCTYENINKYLK